MVVRVIDVRIIVGRSVLNLIYVYVPRTGKQMEEKFFTQLWKAVSDIELHSSLAMKFGSHNQIFGPQIDTSTRALACRIKTLG